MINRKTFNLHLILAPLFIILGLITSASILGYFHLHLAPQLNERVVSHSQIIAKSLSHELMHKPNLENEFLLQKELSKILLYSDQNNETFILGLSLELNPEYFNHKNTVLRYGVKDCSTCFPIKIILTDISTSEILGKISYHINPKSHNEFLQEISNKFKLIAISALVFILFIWLVVHYLFTRTISSQNELILSSKHNQAILNSMLDMIFLIDENGNILESNKAAQKNLNLSPDELKKTKICDLIKPQSINNTITKKIKSLDNQIMEISFMQKGEERFGILNSSTIKTNSFHSNYLLVIKDTHDLHLAQNKLKYQAKVAHTSRLKSLGEMSSGIAHEINQPLAIIRLGVEGIKDILLANDPEALEVSIADDVLSQVDRASNIINQMRSFARFESSPKEWISPTKPINSALSFLKDQLRVHNIELIEDFSDGCPPVLLELQKAEQILINLIINARHALDQVDDSRKKEIKVSLSCTQNTVTLTVIDNGIGMSSETLERCLDPFYTTKSHDEGTGLGLAIVKSIADEFNIILNINSELNKGTKVDLTMSHKKTGNKRV